MAKLLLPSVASTSVPFLIITIITAVVTISTAHGSVRGGPSGEGRSDGGTVPSRWVLFGGEYSEEFDWLLRSYADLASGFVYKISPKGFPWGKSKRKC